MGEEAGHQRLGLIPAKSQGLRWEDVREKGGEDQ